MRVKLRPVYDSVLATFVPNRTEYTAQVAAFHEETGGSVVFKPFVGATWQFTGTQRLTSDLLARLDCMAYAPVIFQEEIRKAADVRVNIIDGSGLCAADSWQARGCPSRLAHAPESRVHAALVAV